jgi:hypothetical protein
LVGDDAPASNFKYEQDYLKHYVRHFGWLPMCRERLKRFKSSVKDRPPAKRRRIRYFTFCAVGAIDVLMLDVAKIVYPSATGRFDTVVFFDKTNDLVVRTQETIPGAIGFTGQFLNAVLLDDPGHEDAVDDAHPLDVLQDVTDSRAVRDAQRLREVRRQFIARFPFDILNFDLQEFFFKPNDPMPGRMIRALENVFKWQKLSGTDNQGNSVNVTEFTLMFTTRIGPANLSEDYLDQLSGCLQSNLAREPALRQAFENRVGHSDFHRLRSETFDLFFLLGMPKVLASVLRAEGWTVEPPGISIYEFTRPEPSPPYKMLHLMMQVRRKAPHLPGNIVVAEEQNYTQVISHLFETPQIVVDEAVVEPQKPELDRSLAAINGRRKKYLSGK